MKLREIAHSRTGDKGNTANISLFAYRAEDFKYLCDHITADVVRRHFNNPQITSARRYEIPALSALNFVLDGALSGGVTQSLALDAHGKCLGSILLDMELPDRT